MPDILRENKMTGPQRGEVIHNFASSFPMIWLIILGIADLIFIAVSSIMILPLEHISFIERLPRIGSIMIFTDDRGFLNDPLALDAATIGSIVSEG